MPSTGMDTLPVTFSNVCVKATVYPWPPTGEFRVSVKKLDWWTEQWVPDAYYICKSVEAALVVAKKAVV